MSLSERGVKLPWWGWLAALAVFGFGLGAACLGGAGLALALQDQPAAPRPRASDDRLAQPAETLVVVTPQASSAPYAQVGDVPLPEGVRPEAAVGGSKEFSLITQLSFDQVAAFYQSAMPEQGWALVKVDDALADRLLDLQYEKGDQTVALKIVRIPFVGTLIAATTLIAE